jgi:hypothetical protein
MRRGKSQVLYNYLPGNTFDYDNDEGIYIVKDFNNRKLEPEELNKKYITGKITQYLDQWSEEMSEFADVHSPHSYYFCRVSSVVSAMYPLVFQCVNDHCRRVYSFRSVDGMFHTCSHCGRGLRQLHYIAYHSCGEIRPLYVPKCPTHAMKSIVLETKNSQRIANFVWNCTEPGCGFTRRVFQTCTCTENAHMSITVHSKSETYYPHQVVFINLRDDLIEKLLNDEGDTAHVILAAYFRLFDHPKTSLRALLSSGSGADQDAQVEQMVVLFRNMGFTEAMIADEIDRLRGKAVQQEGQQATQLKRQVNELVPFDDVKLTHVAEQLFELIKLQEESKIKIRSIKDLTSYVEYKRSMDRLGLTDVRLIENLPVTTAVFGYSRGSREPGHSKMKPFPSSAQTENKYPVYVDTTNSESLLFELDHRRVLAWLKSNGLHDLDVVAMSDSEIKAWFLANLSDVDTFGQINAGDKITAYTYGLTHSISHLILKSCTLLSGFDRSSLSEYIFDKALSFIIYANNRQNFVIGGMYTTFENHLSDLLDRIVELGDTCVYDPVCSEHGGACHGCMHIAEFSCDGYNRNLGRNYVFGGDDGEGSLMVGYLEIG